MDAFLLTYGIALLAELGDKSQLVAVTFAARHKFWPVLIGFSIGAAAAQGIAVLFGSALGEVLPAQTRNIGAGVLFLGFAVWTLRSHDDDDADEIASPRVRAVVLTVAIGSLLAEMGDKTQLATAVLAARQAPLPTWLGSTLGEISASVVAMGVGAWLGKRLPMRALHRGGAVVFALVGVALLFDALRG